MENIHTKSILEKVIKLIEWTKRNTSKSEFEMYGASGCVATSDLNVIDEFVKLTEKEASEIFINALNHFEGKKRATDIINYLIIQLDDDMDVKKIIDSDPRFEYFY